MEDLFVEVPVKVDATVNDSGSEKENDFEQRKTFQEADRGKSEANLLTSQKSRQRPRPHAIKSLVHAYKIKSRDHKPCSLSSDQHFACKQEVFSQAKDKLLQCDSLRHFKELTAFERSKLRAQ